jgi:hypothetical protein
LPRYCCLSDRYLLGVANLGDEEWARSSSFSAPRVGSFDILFVGGHEAVCAVAIEPPPPFLRPRSRPPHLSDACAHPSAARSRASRMASGRDGRAPRVQGRWVGWVDDVGRASGRLRPHPPRQRRIGSMTPTAAAVVLRPPRVVTCAPLLAWQVPPARLAARHGRRAAWRQARGRRERRWRRWRRRRARRRRSPRSV